MRVRRATIERTPEFRKKRCEYAKKYISERKKRDPVWAAKERARVAAWARNRRKIDPEFRKKCYDRHTEWARKNRDHVNEKQRLRVRTPHYKLVAKKNLLRRKYGLTHEQYLEKRKAQNEKCPICSNPIGVGAVDHNHTTGKIRDILCRYCNCWIGFIEKNPSLVKPMINYLKRWNNPDRLIP